MRRLWRGETVIGHDGPCGRYPFLRLDPDFDEHIPMAFMAFGPQSLALGGRAFDHVVLHTFFTDETLVRCVATVKEAAERAGRDPATVRVWSCLATVGDHLPEDVRLKKTVGRMATYLQAYGDLMVEHQRLGSRGARALPGRPVRGRLPQRPRCQGHHRGARARRHPDPRGLARSRGDGPARPGARRRCSTSSTSVPTA